MQESPNKSALESGILRLSELNLFVCEFQHIDAEVLATTNDIMGKILLRPDKILHLTLQKLGSGLQKILKSFNIKDN